MILLARFMQATGHLQNSITVEHYHDLGKWLFGIGVVFWAYIAFSQYMLIWYANLPVETNWYMTRQLGGWGCYFSSAFVWPLPFTVRIVNYSLDETVALAASSYCSVASSDVLR